MTCIPSYLQLRKQLDAGDVSAVSLVAKCLEKCRERESLNAFLELFEEEAMQRAVGVDRKLKEGKAGRLAGMVIGIKDNLCYRDHRLSAGSKILAGFSSLYSATVIERILAEDAIIIGRQNCDEFAMGGSNENSAHGPVRNPLDETLVPGGSSGGSAASVAGGLCMASLASDTGGSIRQPAAFCGVVGLKPTYGRVSRYGLIAYGSSFDQVGPIASSVHDAALLLEVIAGDDSYDSTVSTQPVPAYANLITPGKKYRVALLRETMEHPSLDPGIKAAITSLAGTLSSAGFGVEEVDFPLLEYAVPAYYILATAEASSNLARYDGVHYGYRSPASGNLDSLYRKSRTEGFGAEVKRRIMTGTFVLSSGYYDAYYTRAQKVRRLVSNRLNEIFANHDFILMPSTPTTAFRIGEIQDPVAMYLQDIYTVLANLAGIPAISIPLGLHTNGLPIGVQLHARPFAEAPMMAMAAYIAQSAAL